MTTLTRRSFAASAAVLAAGAAIPVRAQDKPVIKVSSLTLPVFNPLVWNVMKARGFDAKHGFSLDIHAYPSIAAFYAAFAWWCALALWTCAFALSTVLSGSDSVAALA